MAKRKKKVLERVTINMGGIVSSGYGGRRKKSCTQGVLPASLTRHPATRVTVKLVIYRLELTNFTACTVGRGVVGPLIDKRTRKTHA